MGWGTQVSYGKEKFMIAMLCYNVWEGLCGVADGKALPVEIDFLLVFNWTRGVP
jgi:hypothetical protein